MVGRRITLALLQSRLLSRPLVYPGGSQGMGQGQFRAFSSSSSTTRDVGQMSLEEPEAKERGGGWVIKALSAVMLAYIAMNVGPIMGDGMVRHSVALVKVRDPLFKRTGASRLSWIATDDARRKKIVDAGGVTALMGMLQTASDDETRREAVKALVSLSNCDAAVEALYEVEAHPVMHTLAASTSDLDIQQHTSVLLLKLDQWKASKLSE